MCHPRKAIVVRGLHCAAGRTAWGSLRVAYGESSHSSNVTIGNPAPVVIGSSILLPFTRNNLEAGVLVSDDGSSWEMLATLPVPKVQARFGAGA